MSSCRLLLVGVDWRRKGADLAVEVAAMLATWGVPCVLTVVGCAPPAGQALPANIEVIPFIGKASVEDRRRLHDLYARSHFFIMPSRAEAFGIVFAEASTFGVPCVATRVGGLPTVIRSGVNGELFPLHAGPEAYAAWILDIWRDEARYRQLALNAAEEGATRLSWSVAGRRVADIFHEIIEQRAAGAALPPVGAEAERKAS
jgi:glycosyltransferase involved in cell wall biosynthesis